MRGLGLLAQDKGGSYYIGSPALGNVIKSVYVADIFATGAEGVHDERLIDKVSATYDNEEDEEEDESDAITVNNEENQQMMARMKTMEAAMRTLLEENARLKTTAVQAPSAAAAEAEWHRFVGGHLRACRSLMRGLGPSRLRNSRSSIPAGSPKSS